MIENCSIQHLELASTIKSISNIEHFIDDVYELYNLNEDQYGNILIALTEALNNSIIHGNKLDTSKKVRLSMEKKQDELVFIVSDEGQGFDYMNVPNPTLPENITKINGRGIFLIESLADEILFENKGSKLTLRFSVTVN